MALSTKKTFGNDKHCVMYITGEEVPEPNSFPDSSFVQNNIDVLNVTRATGLGASRFGTHSYWWGTSQVEDRRGLSAQTSSYYVPGTKDFAIDCWFKFVSPGTYGAVDMYAMADASDPTNNFLLIQAFAATATTSLYWYFYIRNSGTYVLEFDRNQTTKFSFNSWYHFTFSRKNLPEGGDSYSFYVGNTTERHSYWFTGATTATQEYKWTSPIIYIGKPTGGILPDGYNNSLNNVYLDTIRYSVGEARKWAPDASVSGGEIEFGVPGKPVYFTPNRAY